MPELMYSDIDPEAQTLNINDSWTQYGAVGIDGISLNKTNATLKYYNGSSWVDVTSLTTPIKTTSTNPIGVLTQNGSADATITPRCTFNMQVLGPGVHQCLIQFSGGKGFTGIQERQFTITVEAKKHKKYLRLTDKKRLKRIR